MLDPWIIEERRRRESQDDRPVLELELEIPVYEEPDHQGRGQVEGVERGVAVIDFGV